MSEKVSFNNELIGGGVEGFVPYTLICDLSSSEYTYKNTIAIKESIWLQA